MRYKERHHTRITDRDILGICKICKQEKPLRWIKHEQRKNGGYYSNTCRECRALQERERRNSQVVTHESVMKICKKCKNNRLHRWISDSRNKSGGYYQNICLKCHSDYIRFHWHEIKKESVKYLGGKCKDCGLQDSCVSIYDFHHRDSSIKDFNIGSLFKGKQIRQFEEIKTELDKCDLLCSNCHRRRHSKHECCKRKI